MKKIILLLSIVVLFACSEDEENYVNSDWSGASGIIKPDTVEFAMNIDVNNYQTIFRSSLACPSYPNNDSLTRRYVFASYYKTGKIFGEVDNFYLNDTKLTYYKQLFYPSYYYNTESFFSMSNNEMNLRYSENGVENNYSILVDDIFKDLEVSNNTFDSDIDITFDNSYDMYSLHAYFINYNELGKISNISLNKTYELLTTDNKFTINKSVVDEKIKSLGLSLDFVQAISFSIIATDTTEVMLGNRNTLIYKSAEKIINLKY